MLFDKKDMAAGIRAMRTVVEYLTAWADDLEKSEKAKPGPVTAADAVSAPAADAGKKNSVPAVRAADAGKKTSAPAARAADAGKTSAPAAGAGKPPVPASETEKKTSVPVAVAVDAGKPSAPAADAEKKSPVPDMPTAPYKLEDLKALLVFLCSKGYSNQVKAVIESYGVAFLSDVPTEAYGEIVEAVRPVYGAAIAKKDTQNQDGGDSDD